MRTDSLSLVAMHALGIGILAAACLARADADPTCTALDGTGTLCWQQVAPLGSGGFPPETGSNDTPKWEPGRWPMTPKPVVGTDDKLWALSQTHAWSSTDGLHWTHYRKTDWGERIGHAVVLFGNRLWMFGGLHYGDRVPLNDIWSSPDGVTWTVHGSAQWSPRTGYAIAVLRDKLWLFGGADQVRHDFTTLHTLNDVWSSDDGLHWTPVTAAAVWPAREDASVLVYKDALYLIGGNGQADVWTSADGTTWARRTSEAPWKHRFGYGAAVFAGKLWVYGGWHETPTDCLNDLWYSSDGEHWIAQTEHAPWSPRSPRTVVYADRLWIFSGKHTGAKDSWGGDIWAMAISP